MAGKKHTPWKSRIESLNLNRKAQLALQNGEPEEGEQLLLQAVELYPKNSQALFNLGLILKIARDWDNSAMYSKAAAELNPRSGEPALWNLGIAATALHDWDTARWAWKTYGIPIESESNPIDAPFGLGPVRIFSNDGFEEVVWGHRLDPARIQIESVPFPESGHLWHDIVLHDGAPNGEREYAGRMLPVFDELEIWEKSTTQTLECQIDTPSEDVSDLILNFTDLGWGAEDWTTNVNFLCKQCSESSLESDPKSKEHDCFTPEVNGKRIGIAAPLEVAEELLEKWAHSKNFEYEIFKV